jgi:ABC-type lipoprotein export system ATPase subunit
MADVVLLQGVTRVFDAGSTAVHAVEDVTLRVGSGEAVAIVGPSGSGKTTLLHLIAGLDRPTRGMVTVLGEPLNDLGEAALTAFRRGGLGLVFQEPYLFPGLTALENVMVPKLPQGRRRQLEPKAKALLDAVGLSHRYDHPPSRLSGGERQRVAIARALIGEPTILLADEPTGNIDGKTTEAILRLLQHLRRERGLTMIVVTHDAAVAAVADRAISMAAGRIGDGRWSG